MAAPEEHTVPEGYQHAWDTTPHSIWADVPVEDIKLGDYLAGGALCVEGIASAEHRGKPAIRLDVENMATGGKGRVVLTAGQRIGDVKRYDLGVGDIPTGPSNRRLAESIGQHVGAVPADDDGIEAILRVARVWADDDGGPYEDDEQRLFAFLCIGVEAYSRLMLRTTDVAVADRAQRLQRENAYTLGSIAENVCPVYELRARS